MSVSQSFRVVPRRPINRTNLLVTRTQIAVSRRAQAASSNVSLSIVAPEIITTGPTLDNLGILPRQEPSAAHRTTDSVYASNAEGIRLKLNQIERNLFYLVTYEGKKYATRVTSDDTLETYEVIE